MPNNTVTHKDRIYSPEDAAEISMLRSERWALLLHIAECSRQGYDDRKKYDERTSQPFNRVRQINKRLFKLTENPIYYAA